MLNRLTDSIDFQAEALKLRSERQRLIASNIANADTPGYTSKDFKFADALSQATGRRSAGHSSLTMPVLQMVTGSANHMNRGGSPAGAGAKPELGYGTASMSSLDNNSVDMDRERANFADNTVRYEATLRFINGSMKTLTTAINGQ
ncbi:MAG: flagellar basal body rod protein FlgB [Aquabacterium sp.]|uniref:flagellar basal body rod protein FlgB n=1 Tax=Aquabacterium sp. TaxID=1872578 RepID=UPI003BB1FD6D